MPGTETNYQLVNPYVTGNFNRLSKGKCPATAAKRVYKRLASNFNQSVPQYYISIERLKDGKLFHFQVEEEGHQDGGVDFTMTQITTTIPKKEIEDFRAQLQTRRNMEGGRWRDMDENEDDKQRYKPFKTYSHSHGTTNSLYGMPQPLPDPYAPHPSSLKEIVKNYPGINLSQPIVAYSYYPFPTLCPNYSVVPTFFVPTRVEVSRVRV